MKAEKLKKSKVKPKGGAPPEAPAVALSGSASVAQIRALRERFSVLSAAYVAFFELRQPTEKALKTGARTVAADVFDGMVQLAVQYERARATSPTVARFISVEQMRWLCDQTVLLGDAIARRDHAGVTTVTVSTLVQAAWDAARPVRNELTGAMEEYAKGRREDEAALSEVRGAADKPESTERSLSSLAKLAAQWIARTDDVSQIAAAEAALTRELVERAKAAEAALTRALGADRAHEGSRRTKQDTPEINALEGRVVLTLKAVRSKHNRAREVDPTVVAVPVPDALAAVLGVVAKAASKAPATPAGGDPATPASTDTKPAKKRKKTR